MEVGSYSSAVEEIKSRCNIVDLISAVVPLKRSGSNYQGCCPFHNDKTPSFSVSETRQTYHCFACGEHGDAVGFVMKYYNKPFTEAVDQLAAQYGITIDTKTTRQALKKDPYYEINRLAARYFFKAMAAKGSPGFEYMSQRGMSPQTLQKFGIGYADGSWSSLYDELTSRGISREMLSELGLVKLKDKGGFDIFRDRVIFPIINTQGKVIAFGGRIIGNGNPKYLNSPESLVYHKRENLFGLNLTRSEIQKEGYAIVVEGYMDVVGLYQAGVKNVTASLGTALTDNQARLLSRYTKKVVLCYDSDAAGRKAALAGIDILRAAGLETRVLHVDDGKDPDEYIKEHGKEGFLDLVDNKSMSDIDYKVYVSSRNHDIGKTEGRLVFFKEAAMVLSTLDPVERELYIKKISADYNFSEGALRNQAEGIENSKAEKEIGSAPANEDKRISPQRYTDGLQLLEKTVIRLLFLKGEYYPEARDNPGFFVTEAGQAIFEALGTIYTEGCEFELTDMKDSLSEEHLDYLLSILDEIQVGENDRKAFDDCIEKLRSEERNKRISEIGDILSMADSSVDEEYLNNLTDELINLTMLNKQAKA